MVGIKNFDMPNTCGDCPYCIHTADEKRYIGYCNTSDDDYYCKALDRFMEYDKVDGGVDILGKPLDCPLVEAIPKADYENRLKADMVAMLEKLKLEIKELWDSRYDVWLDNQYYIGKSDTLEEVDEVITQKIDALKVVSEPQESEDKNA